MHELMDPVTLLPPVVLLEVELVARGTVALPGWLGSTLHGGLGGALRALVCSSECERLHEAEPGRCAFARLFAPPAANDAPAWIAATAAPPLALRPPAPAQPRNVEPGAALTFAVVLVGERAIADTALVIAALERMAARGLGKGRAPLELARVRAGDELVWEGGRELAAPRAAMPARRNPETPVTLRARTPLCIVRDGRPALPRFEDVVAASARRVLVLATLHGRGVTPETRVDALRERARAHAARIEGTWVPFHAERWSSRQRRRHPVEGHVGEMAIAPPGPFLGWLEAAALVGIGKGTALGLGHVELE